MRVAIVYGGYPPKRPDEADGGADFVRSLAQKLTEQGLSILVVTSGNTEIISEGRPSDRPLIRRIVSDWSWWAAVNGELRKVKDVLVAEGIEILHIIYPDPYLRYGSDTYHLPFFLKLVVRKPTVVTLFGFALSKSKFSTKLGLFTLLANSDRLVITDVALLARFRRLFPWWRKKAVDGLVASIPMAPKVWSRKLLHQRRLEMRLPINPSYVAFFGFWSPDKGLESLCDAVQLLNRGGRDVTLLVIGGRPVEAATPYEQSILTRINSATPVGSIVLTGPLSEAGVSQCLLASDVCVLPFRTNPLGRSSLALALTLGIPTITSRPPAQARLLDGIPLVDRVTKESLASEIERVLSNTSLQEEISIKALVAAKHWSWESILDQYRRIYSDLRVGKSP